MEPVIEPSDPVRDRYFTPEEDSLSSGESVEDEGESQSEDETESGSESEEEDDEEE